MKVIVEFRYVPLPIFQNELKLFLLQYLFQIPLIVVQFFPIFQILHHLIYSGGLEAMFDGKKRLEVELPEGSSGHTHSIQSLIEELRRKHLREKEEMFVQAGSVRPGIIVLVNDTDWELLDTLKYQLENGDNVAFISTLHGGWKEIKELLRL